MHFIQLYKELRRNQQLADKRAPMFEQNRFAKIFIYGMIVFWAAYMLFLGIMLPFAFMGIFPSMEPYHILNQGAIYLLLLDFITRFSFQKPPVQEVKPYQLLPVPRNRVIDFFLLRSATNSYNFFWFFLLVPFAFLALFRFYGFGGVAGFLVGWWLLIILNNFWYLLCRTLISEKITYLLLPIAFYALWGVVEYVPEGHLLSQFCMNFLEGFFLLNPLSYLGVTILIAALVWIVRILQLRFTYNELGNTGKSEDSALKNVSEYRFLDRFGDLGEYLRLEIKLTMRNKMVRGQFILGMVLMVIFSLLLSFTEVYDGNFMTSFICIYSFVVLGIMTLTRIMSVEGNYLDGLMSRRESILSLLRAKYLFNCAILIVPFVLMIPTFITGKVSLLMALAFALITAGPVYCMLFQLAVYNKKTIPLNTKLTGKNSGGNFLQSLLSSSAIFLPIIINSIMCILFGEQTGLGIQAAIGGIFVLASPWWLRNIYNRFMHRRYENMDGFRNSR
ncbi:MAG: hypothetical protein IJX44_02255 [Bacteroidaceae bacterium]|nr:hypothetical protein [Bacteroidaceae bacterium]